MQALLSSVQRAGVHVQPNSRDCDAAIIWSVLWQGRMSGNRQIYEHYRAQQRPVIIAEIGCLHRGLTWKIAVNNITIHGHYGNDQDLDPDRPKKLNVQLRHGQNNDRILIALQHRHSLQTQDILDWHCWINSQIDDLRLYTDRPIVIRPHPRDQFVQQAWRPDINVQIPKLERGTYDSFDWSDNYHAVINHNSGPGILAAVAGVRPVVDRSSLAHPVSISMQDIEKKYETDRNEWLVQLCHTEYTLDEIQQGLWLKRLASWLN